MPTLWAWVLLGGGLLIVAGLVIYAGYLLREIKRREAFRRDEVRRAHDNCLENLDVMARAMLADQVDLIEGCLRCRVMLDILDPTLLEDGKLQIFQQVQLEAAHLRTHQARADLSRQAMMKEDAERFRLMACHRERILVGARHLLLLTEKRWGSND